MNSVTILCYYHYDNNIVIRCAMRRFRLIGFLLPIYYCVWTLGGGRSSRFSYNENTNNADRSRFRYLLANACVCVRVRSEVRYTTNAFVLLFPTRMYEINELGVLKILERHISIYIYIGSDVSCT